MSRNGRLCIFMKEDWLGSQSTWNEQCGLEGVLSFLWVLDSSYKK